MLDVVILSTQVEWSSLGSARSLMDVEVRSIEPASFKFSVEGDSRLFSALRPGRVRIMEPGDELISQASTRSLLRALWSRIVGRNA